MEATPPACPRCGRPGTPVIYGLPTPAATEAIREGLIVGVGCVLSPEPDDWCCADGHRWRVGDEALWNAALDGALRGRPHCPDCAGESTHHVYAGTIGEELWADEIAAGTVVVAHEPGPPGVNWQQICRRCGKVWTPRR